MIVSQVCLMLCKTAIQKTSLPSETKKRAHYVVGGPFV